MSCLHRRREFFNQLINLTIQVLAVPFHRSVNRSRLHKYSLWGLDDSGEEYQETMKEVHTRSAEKLLAAILDNGGLYIKFGQGMCTHGVLPQEYSKVLVVLQDHALRRDCDDEIDQMFLQDFGKTKAELFESFSEEPIAAASLAQVTWLHRPDLN